MREPDRIVRLKAVFAPTGLSRSTIYRKMEGTFPAQPQISTNGTGWHESLRLMRGRRIHPCR